MPEAVAAQELHCVDDLRDLPVAADVDEGDGAARDLRQVAEPVWLLQ